MVHRFGVVGRRPALQSGGPGSIPGGVRDFNLYLVTVSVSLLLEFVITAVV